MLVPRVLIVEDELIVALELQDRLQHQGYSVVGTARSADEALAMIRDEAIDLALLDIRLIGERDGIDLARDLQALDVPVVFLTAHGDDETLARVTSVGPQGYLLKPFDERLLRLTIETALHRHKAERARLEAVRAQRDAQTMQATILAHSPDAVFVVDARGKIDLANTAARTIFELDSEVTELPLLHELLPCVDDLQLFARRSPRYGRRVEARRSSGERFPAELVSGLAPLDDEDRLILIVRDVSAQIQLEQQLARARQLEVTGRFASGVAHDLNNLLSVVWMSTYMMRQATPSEARGLIEELENAVTLGSALTTRLLSMGHHGEDEAREVDVNDALRTIGGLVKRSVGMSVHLVLELDPAAGTIHIDPTQLDQIVLNLTLNADRAMPEGGRLTLRSLATMVEGEPSHVTIEVEDTGVGMNAKVQRRLFEPFFSTRHDAGGTGLGLSIVKEMSDRMGGRLEFESELGKGTRFRLTLTRHDADPSSQPHREPASLVGQGRAVLLVDHDEAHRRLMARVLETKGFHALEACSAGVAELMAERGHERLALAIVDIQMPYGDGDGDGDGIELGARLKQLRPGMPVVLISDSSGMMEAKHSFASAVLRKPLQPESLFEALARLLDEPGVAS